MSSLVARGSRASAAAAVATTVTKASVSATPIISSGSRSFSSFPASGRQQIPPQSPLFINVPTPPQDQSVEERRNLKPVKGHLPTPRQVFKNRDGHIKPTEPFLSKSAPEPSSEKSQQPARSDIQAWKRRMAVFRRDNMKSGVRDLWERKQIEDRRRSEKQARKLALNRSLAMAPEPLDELLTSRSVDPETLKTAVMPDPLRFERALASQARTNQVLETKSEHRRDAIQELYMNARQFIVDEASLHREVEKQFAPDFWSKQSSRNEGSRNIWDQAGGQKSINMMLAESNLMQERKSGGDTRTVKRQQRLAEELTGGRMEDLTKTSSSYERQRQNTQEN